MDHLMWLWSLQEKHDTDSLPQLSSWLWSLPQNGSGAGNTAWSGMGKDVGMQLQEQVLHSQQRKLQEALQRAMSINAAFSVRNGHGSDRITAELPAEASSAGVWALAGSGGKLQEQTVSAGGISVEEISRFFERDARRYG